MARCAVGVLADAGWGVDVSEYDDGIPGPPNRPDRAEFWQLSEIVLNHDAQAQDDGGLVRVIERFIPEEVATYVAWQRCLRADVPPLMFFITTLAASWLDGFAAGAAYQKKYGDRT